MKGYGHAPVCQPEAVMFGSCSVHAKASRPKKAGEMACGRVRIHP